MEKKCCIMLILLCCWCFFNGHLKGQQISDWQIIGIMPVPVAGGQAVVHDSLIYIIGGYTDPTNVQGSLIDLVQTYNPTTGAWDSAPVHLNSARAGFAAGIYNQQLYIGGGVWEPSGQPFLYSIDCWDFLSPFISLQFNPQFDRTNCSGLVYNEKMYLVGGTQAGNVPVNLSYLVEFDLNTRTTISHDTLFGNIIPIQQMTARIQDDIYIFGGYLGGVLRLVFKFNTINRSFTPLASLNRERAGGAAIALDDKDIFLIGGYNEDANQVALDSLTIYNTESELIHAGPNLNVGRSDLMVVKYNNEIYAFGGFDNNFIITALVEKIDILTPILPPEPVLQTSFELFPNFPNPFNPETHIRYRLEKSAPVRIDVYSVLGEYITTLVNQNMPPGMHQTLWDGRDDEGRPVSSGIYIYQMVTEGFSDSQKMMLVR